MKWGNEGSLVFAVTQEDEYILRDPALVGLGAFMGALLLYQLGANTDFQLLSEKSYVPEDGTTLSYPINQPIITSVGNEVPAQQKNLSGLYGNELRANIPLLGSPEDPQVVADEITTTVKAMTKVNNQFSVDAIIFDPLTSAVTNFALFGADGGVPVSEHQTDSLLFYNVQTGVNVSDQVSKVEQVKIAVASAWGEDAMPSISPSYVMTINVPYTVSEYQNMYNLAVKNGFNSIEQMNLSLVDASNPTLLHQAQQILYGKNATLNLPSVMYRIYPSSGKGAALPGENVCEVNTAVVSESYTALHEEHQVEPVSFGLSAALITSVLMATRIKKRRRVVGGIPAPSRSMQAAAENGTARTMDKLHVLAFRQAAAKESTKGMISHRKVTSHLFRRFAQASAVVGGISFGAAYFLANDRFVPVDPDIPAAIKEIDCPSDMLVVRNVMDKVYRDESFFVGREDLDELERLKEAAKISMGSGQG
jgi:hypothetical protein